MDELPTMQKNKISGPILISLGDQEKLDKFLENNPKVPRNLLLLDDYSLNAYNALGFGKIAENKEMAKAGTKNMQAPSLGFKEWITYFKTVGGLAKGLTKDAALQIGGTFVIEGNNFLFFDEEGVPGDYPKPKEVLKKHCL